MKYTFKELIDLPKLQELTDELYTAASIPSAVITVDGEILTGSGWQKICADFHRKHQQIEKECIESDITIRKKLDDGEPFVIYKCPRGLVDASAPVIIAGEHMANVFSGQVFLEPPDETTEQFFREQARKFGFDETDYIKAFKEVPIFTEKKFRAGITFLAKLAQSIADTGFTRLRELEAMEVLREGENKFRSFAEQSLVGIYLISDDVFKYVNPKFAEMFGYSVDECLDNMHFPQLVHPEDLATVKEQVGRRVSGETKAVQYSFRGITKSGDTIHVEIFGSFMVLRGEIVATGTMLEITDRKQAEEKRKQLQAQLQQALKMEAMGTLAGGIAHDFNNLLMAIEGRASIMLMNKASSHPDFRHLKGIEENIESAADLTRQLLGFARGRKYEVKPTDLNEVVKKENRMFGRTKKEITIRGKYGKDLWTVEVDRGQIEQVLLNLYVNAWQAMPGGGELYLETENVALDETDVKPFPIEPGKYVKISVIDTGVGMDKATREKIFEPFFTTKEMGRGTGLGLASAYGIVKNHGGFINVYSEKGHGTTFNIYLPASEKEIIEEKKPAGDTLRGSETVLFVDDEDMIIEIAEEIFEQLGYKVLTARSGKEAIEIYEKNKEQIDIVLLDMIMPDMSGSDTYDKMKKIDPDIKVLLSSGYSINGQATEIMDRGCNGFIQKPFKMKELSQKLREILDKK
ncbi:MAG: response regulator [Deltaproteobacteria bacterium]|nr:response regulator [Deltaproteobacteria bacterium]